MKVISDISLWILPLCLLFAVGIAFLSYFRNKKNSFSKTKLFILALLRGFSALFISILLLSLLVRIEKKQLRKPDIILLHDNSQSIAQTKNIEEWLKNWQKISDKLSSKFNVINVNFGQDIKLENKIDFTEKSTDISKAIIQSNRQLGGKNLASIVVATDGISTFGDDISIVANKVFCPIYSIGLGDTATFVDVAISKVESNKYAYLGNISPVEVNIKATKLKNQKLNILLKKENQILDKQEILVDDNIFFKTINFHVKADKLGIQHYNIELQSVVKEKNSKNNFSTFNIEVLETKKKILICAAVPHPDISALKQILGNNDEYEVEFCIGNLPKNKPDAYNLVILHQVPSLNNSLINNFLQELWQSNTPELVFVGEASDFSSFNSHYKSLLQIFPNNQSLNEVLPVFNENFAYFQISDDILKKIQSFPPAKVLSGKYIVSENASTLFYQKVMNVSTEMPLLLFQQNIDKRTGIFSGDALWRWKLHDFLLNQNFDATSQFVDKIIRYLSAGKDKQVFSLDLKNVYDENEEVIIDAFLYDDAFEAVGNAEIKMDLTDEAGNVFHYMFSNRDNFYHLNIGHLTSGKYSYEVIAKYASISHTKKGNFWVEQVNTELVNLQANHQVLNTISAETKGKFYEPQQYEKLIDNLLDSEHSKAVAFSSINYFELINIKIFFALIIILLSAEWFLRRFLGQY